MFTNNSENFDIQHTPWGIHVNEETDNGLIHVKIKNRQYIAWTFISILLFMFACFFYVETRSVFNPPDTSTQLHSSDELGNLEILFTSLPVLLGLGCFIYSIVQAKLVYTIRIDQTSWHFVITTRNNPASAIEFMPENTAIMVQVINGGRNGAIPTMWRRVQIVKINANYELTDADDPEEEKQSILLTMSEKEARKLSGKPIMPLVNMEPLTKTQAQYVEQLITEILKHGSAVVI